MIEVEYNGSIIEVEDDKVFDLKGFLDEQNKDPVADTLSEALGQLSSALERDTNQPVLDALSTLQDAVTEALESLSEKTEPVKSVQIAKIKRDYRGYIESCEMKVQR